MKLLIKKGRIWDGEEFFFADVLTDGQKIAKIEREIADSADFIYDATGKTVSAGLVDLHVHMRVKEPEQYGIQAEMSCFPFGVTAAVDAGRSCGKEILDTFMLKNLVFVGSRFESNRLDRKSLIEGLARMGEKAVGIKVYFDRTVSDVSDISALREVCAFAHERALPVMVHCAHSPATMAEILATLSEGDILTHAFHGGENNATADGFTSMREAKTRGIIIDTGFAGNVHTDFSVFKRGIACGVLPDTLSTDITKYSAYMRGGRYGMTMCMSMAKTAGMSEEAIFKAVTQTPARVLGKDGEWGRLSVGRIADIAVFDYTDESFALTDRAGNRIESKSGYRCVMTVADGQIVYKD